jgi:organic radical activating enzyme
VDELLSPDGLPNLSTQLPGTPQRIYRPDPDYEIVEQHVIYVQGRDDQAEDRTRANIKAAADIAMRHGYMLSVQIHKIAELP